MTRTGLVVGLIAAALAVPVAAASGQTEGTGFTEGLKTSSGAVSTVSPQAAKAAVDILDQGGNALDAAVTATFVNGVVRPELCGLGGGGTLVYRAPGGDAAALDFTPQSPVKYTYSTGLTLDPFTGSGTGNNVVGVPGMLAGLDAALERYGTITLGHAIDPAHDIARDGFLVTEPQAALFAANAGRLRLFVESARAYLKPDGSPYAAGERLVQPDYAETLGRIADRGTQSFYDGPVSEAILAGMQGSAFLTGDAGSMSVEDLAGYRPFWHSALQTSYRSARVLTAPPPAAGGLAVVEALNLLEGIKPFPADARSADRFHLLAEAQKIAWADRAAYVGDPRSTSIPVTELASASYAAKRRGEIVPGTAKTYAPTVKPVPSAIKPESVPALSGLNASVAVVDGEGGAAVITCSLEQPFGSAVVAPGTGFLLNSALTAFNAPGTGTAANQPGPHKRPRSNAAPVIMTLDGKPVLAVAGSGGPSAVGGVLNTIVGATDFGLDAARAVDAPRADARGDCGGSGLQLCIENGRLGDDVLNALRARGHVLLGLGEYGPAPVVQAVGVNAGTGERVAAADRRGGPAAAVEAKLLPGLRIRVSPSSVRAGRPARLRFTIRDARGKAIRNAIVRFGDDSTRSDGRGRAMLRGRYRPAGARRAIASKAGYASAVVQVRLRHG